MFKIYINDAQFSFFFAYIEHYFSRNVSSPAASAMNVQSVVKNRPIQFLFSPVLKIISQESLPLAAACALNIQTVIENCSLLLNGKKIDPT
jgi:hypothetical protein